MLIALLGWLAAFVLFVALQQVITLPPEPSALRAPLISMCMFTTYAVMLLATVAVLVAAARRRPPCWQLVLAVAVGGALVALPMRTGAPWPAHLLLNCGGLALAGGLGLLVGNLLRRPGYLLPVLIAAGTVDSYSVFFGPTKKIMAQPQLLSHFLLYWPVLGTERIRGLIGIADFVFAALFLAAAVNFDRPLWRTAAAFAGGCAAAFLALWLLPIAGIPILPFVAAAYLLAEWRFLIVDRTNLKNAAIVTAGVLLVIIPALVYLSA